ncbi:disks large homolog 5-like [Peromyscus californicus insignis]|uniref:disks large homolog 5-like n=1 Tax=Peromyscus californicus insignis TaxID=564181 RepID=UPI0022A75266|nr:disks large homolog 5-like [Peromyscus californicus insignis]
MGDTKHQRVQDFLASHQVLADNSKPTWLALLMPFRDSGAAVGPESYIYPQRLETDTWLMVPSLKIAALNFGASLGPMHFLFLRPPLGTPHDLSWLSAIHLDKYSCVYVPTGTTRKASSTPFFLTEQEQQLNQVDKLTLQLQMMTNERNELLEFLALYNNNELNNRLKYELEMLKTQHKKEMSDVKKFPKEICEVSYKCKELSEQTNSYRTLYSQLLRERTQLKEKMSMLKEDNRKLQGEQILLQESCEEARRLCEEAHEKIYDLWTKQQQEHQRLKENLQSLRKQKELLTQQMDLAVKLQHHFTVSQMR